MNRYRKRWVLRLEDAQGRTLIEVEHDGRGGLEAEEGACRSRIGKPTDPAARYSVVDREAKPGTPEACRVWP